MGGVKKQLPHGWAAAKLGEVTSPRNEKVDPRYTENEAYISLEHIESGTNQIVDVGSSGDVRSTKSVFYTGDILYGKLRPYLNKVCQPDFDGVCSTDILVFGPSLGLDNRFLLRLLSRGETVEYATTHSKGINLPRVNLHQLGELRIELPPLHEQSRIVTKIEELQAHSRRAREALEAVPDLLEQLRQSILASAFRGDLTKKWREDHPDVAPASELLKRIRAERRKRWEESELDKLKRKGLTGETLDSEFAKCRKQYKEPASIDTSNLPELPVGWCWTSLGGVFDVYVGATPSRKRTEFWGPDHYWVSSGEIAWNRIVNTAEMITAEGLAKTSTCLHPRGTVLLGMIGEGKTRGQAAILDIEACNNQNSAAIRVSMTPIAPEYIYRYLQYQYEQTRGGAMGNSQPALNKSKVESIPIPLMPLEEMQRATETIETLLNSSESLEHSNRQVLARVSFLDQSILSKAFRGKLVPQDPSDEPASVLLERIHSEKERLATVEKAIPKRRGRKMKELKQRHILGVLEQADHAMTPEELFAACGFDEDSVDLFYEQLREAVAANLVKETREGDTVRLEAMT